MTLLLLALACTQIDIVLADGEEPDSGSPPAPAEEDTGAADDTGGADVASWRPGEQRTLELRGNAVFFVDVDADGEEEFLVAGNREDSPYRPFVEVFEQAGGERLTVLDLEVAAVISSTGPALGEVDGDGRPDLAIETLDSVTVLHGDGAGGWRIESLPRASVGRGVGLADIQGDERDEVIVLRGDVSAAVTMATVWTTDGAGGLVSTLDEATVPLLAAAYPMRSYSDGARWAYFGNVNGIADPSFATLSLQVVRGALQWSGLGIRYSQDIPTSAFTHTREDGTQVVLSTGLDGAQVSTVSEATILRTRESWAIGYSMAGADLLQSGSPSAVELLYRYVDADGTENMRPQLVVYTDSGSGFSAGVPFELTGGLGQNLVSGDDDGDGCADLAFTVSGSVEYVSGVCE